MMSTRRWTALVGLIAGVAVLGACTTSVQSQSGTPGCGPMSGPGAMMGPTMGPGMMGPGMMGPGMVTSAPGRPSLTLDQAEQAVQACLQSLGSSDLAVEEVMEFEGNFYALVEEKSTGIGAFELLVNKFTGAVFPEPGPNMMWNTRYGMQGHMMGYPQPSGPMIVSAEQAAEIAQRWLDQYLPGSTIEHPDAFYGYYTVHTLSDGTISGMLSVSGYTGQVWYHTWHGAFIAMKESEHEESEH